MTKKSVNIEKIKLLNPWHRDSSFLYHKDAKLHKRQQFYKAKDYLNDELIVSLIGLRRTGKTTTLRQLINHLLQKNTSPRKIFFYEFEEGIVDLDQTLKYYFNNILREDLYTTTCYIFLDELQMIKGWQNVLKIYYDINPNINFIVSGSTHLYLHKDTKESLAGRITDIKLTPFSWYEFLEFKYQKKYSALNNVLADDFFEKIKKESDILLFKGDLLTFISYAEFPYFFKEKDLAKLIKYYDNSVLEKIFLKDIQLFNVTKQREFRHFFNVLNKETASEINFSNLGRELELKKETIKEYLLILEKMFLHKTIYKDAKSLRKQISSFKKGYVQSLNLLNSTLKTNFWDMPKEEFGHIAETFVFNEFQKNEVGEIFFYNDTKKKKEVDFILKKGADILPVEVKIVEDIKSRHLKNLLYYAKKNNCSRAIMIYGGNDLKKQKIDNIQIEFLPYWSI